METNTLNEYNELHIGDKVGSGGERMVIAHTKLHNRIVGDCYATWIAICVDETGLHPYAIWNVIARPDGWLAESGDYCSTLEEALVAYKERGGLTNVGFGCDSTKMIR
jgi:hypothetical protein